MKPIKGLQPEQKKDLLMIDFRAIKPDFEWNPRESYTGIEELADSIELNGIQVPLKGHRLKNDPDGYLFHAIGGYRRLKACMMVLERGTVKSLRVPFMLEAQGTSDVDRLAYTIIENNEGVPLNMLEIANVIKRMQNTGLDDTEIAARINKPRPFVQNCFALLEAPEQAKKLIRAGNISPTLVINIFKKAKDFDKAIAMLTTMAEKMPAEKITARKVEAAEGKVNSVKIMKRYAFKTHKTALVKDDKVELYEFVKKLLSGGFSAEELEDMFFISE